MKSSIQPVLNQLQKQQNHIQRCMTRHLNKTSLFFATLTILLLSFSSTKAQTFTPRYGVSMTSNTGGFWEYLPQGYSSSSSTLYPLIIMIHGMGEYGSGLTSSQMGQVASYGLPKVIKSGLFPVSFTLSGKTYKFIVLTPQWKGQASSSQVNGVIDYALSHYKIDPKRIYLTGLSAGGGVVETAAADGTVGKRVAAVVEFCGTSTASATKAAAIVSNNVAFWGLHNKSDNVVSASKTIGWVDNILKVKSTFAARKTIPSGTSHDCWSSRYKPAYTENGLNIYQWMLQYAKGTVPTTTTNIVPVANAGSDKTIALPTTSTTLSGSGSDADGTISKYSWTKVSGPSTYVFSSTAVANPTVTSLVAGTYVFRLTVTDNKGATDYDDVNVVVNSALTTITTYTVPGKVQAENYSAMDGVQKETTLDAGGGQNVGYIDLHNWMDYSVKTTASGTFAVTFRVASGASAGSQFQVKNSSGTVLTTVTVPNTGGYQTWKDVNASVKLVSGTQTLRLYSTNSARWNINYMNFATSTTTSTATTSVIKIEAESYVGMSGVQKETTTDAGGGQDVGNIDLYDWMYYNINVATAGTYTFTFRLASGSTGAKFQVYNTYNSVKSLVGTVSVPGTGGWQKWTNVTASIKLPAGANTLTFYSVATPRWNVNYFTYGLSNTTTSNVLAANAATTAVAEEDAPTTVSGVSVAPNPFADKFVLTVNNKYTGAMKVQLIDASGAVRKEFQVMKSAAGTTQTYLSAGTLPAGNYFVKVQIGEWSQSTQVVKL